MGWPLQLHFYLSTALGCLAQAAQFVNAVVTTGFLFNLYTFTNIVNYSSVFLLPFFSMDSPNLNTTQEDSDIQCDICTKRFHPRGFPNHQKACEYTVRGQGQWPLARGQARTLMVWPGPHGVKGQHILLGQIEEHTSELQSLTRKHSSLILQLRCGHIPLNVYLHRISKSDTDTLSAGRARVGPEL